MGILDKIFKPKEIKQPRTPYILNYGQASPPDRNLQGYLSAYGEVGWLFAVVSRIAEGVSEAKWRLYSVNPKGERALIYNHPIINLLDFVNPFQTCQEFIELHQIYMGLAGECFWIINKNRLGEPQELWIASPDRMAVVPSRTDFVAGYVYQIGSEKIPLNRDEVLHHKLPNPVNPYRGLGAVQSLAIDLDSELYAGKWNRNFFYNSARPDSLIAFEGTLSEEQFNRLKKQWSERHEGVQRAHKVGLLEGGGKYQQIQFNAKDMDFRALRLLNRDNILGVFGMPLSVMGITENVNKANAEAGDYTFARWLVKPRLNRIKNKLNEQLIPMFKGAKNLELDFDEVVPQTTEQKIAQAQSGITAGYMTINEARQMNGLDTIPTGDMLLTPLNLIPTPTDEIAIEQNSNEATSQNVIGDTAENIAEGEKLNGIQIQAAMEVIISYVAGNIPETVAVELLVAVGIDRERAQSMIDACKDFEPTGDFIDAPIEPPASSPSKSFSTEWKETFWRGYVTRAEAYERKMIVGLKEMFNKQESEAVFKLNEGNKDLIDQAKAKVAYSKLATPILTDLLTQSYRNGSELINPKPPHRGKAEGEPISEAALKWLKTRIAWAALQVGEETARLLSVALAAGYEAGEDIPTIANRVRQIFTDCDRRRSILIARTETISASAQGAISGYEDAGIKEVEFYAALDERTCEDCNSMHGEVFDVGDSIGVIPIHPDCRCTWLPVV